MEKKTFAAKFPNAKYSGKTNTFYLSGDEYGRARKFVQHRFAQFKIAIQE
jgi:hypothetical protein